jgi:glycosyltransferase involved in cell wall biosynthesis
MSGRLLFVVNVDWFFLSHRLPIALAAKQAGHEVHVATTITDRLAELQSHGFHLHPLGLRRGHAGLLAELGMSFELWRLFRQVKPDLVHLVTIRPVILGGLAARLAGVPAVLAAIAGLGHVAVDRGLRARLRRWLVGGLYRLALGGRVVKVIFQNDNDRSCLQRLVGLAAGQCELIRGSGVPLDSFVPRPLPEGVPVVVMACRLIADKGVWEFIAAARQLKLAGREFRACLVGSIDPDNPTSLTAVELESIRTEGVVELWGERADMPQVYAASSLVVLPSSYGEGLPKVLIEAAACGRAIITTDHPGCRDAVLPGVSGVLVPPRDPVALAKAIDALLMDREVCGSMGQAGRRLAEQEFDLDAVVARHLEIYRSLLRQATSP